MLNNGVMNVKFDKESRINYLAYDPTLFKLFTVSFSVMSGILSFSKKLCLREVSDTNDLYICIPIVYYTLANDIQF